MGKKINFMRDGIILFLSYVLCFVFLQSTIEAAEENILYCAVDGTLPKLDAKLTVKLYDDEEVNSKTILSSEECLYKSMDSNKLANFPQDADQFFEIIRKFAPPCGAGQHNHLCLSLYLIYRERINGSWSTKISESPLYAKWKDGEIKINDEGTLIQEKKIKFYTKKNSHPSKNRQLAYFTRHRPIPYGKEPDIFPIPCNFTKVDGENKCFVCKGDGGNHSINCNHTEPNALYCIKDEHFQNLIPKIQNLIPKTGANDASEESNDAHEIKLSSCGIRFFSWYRSCSSCIKNLISYKGTVSLNNTLIPKNIIFYFYNSYDPCWVVNKKNKIFNLESSYANSFFERYLRGNKVYIYPEKDKEDDDTPVNPPLHTINFNLMDKINLKVPQPVILIRHCDNKNVKKIIVGTKLYI